MITFPSRFGIEEHVTTVFGFPLDHLVSSLADSANEVVSCELFASRLLTAANGSKQELGHPAASLVDEKLPDLVRRFVTDATLHTRVLELVTL